MKEKVVIFKELMKNQRYKAIFKLSLFIIFFAVVFIVFDFGSNDEYISSKVNNNDVYDISNYSFDYVVKTANLYDELSTSLSINGYRNDNKYVFEVMEDNLKYYYEDVLFTYTNEILPYTGEKFIDLNLYSPENIEKYIKKGKLDNTTTFADGQIKKVYKIDVVTFAGLINENVITLEGDVCISILVKDDKLQTVELDLLNYNKSNILINYSNINNIKEFNKDSLLK